MTGLVDTSLPADMYGAELIARPSIRETMRFAGFWGISCLDPDGNLKWEDVIENDVVNVGLDHLLDVTLSSGTQITTWYVGLTNGTPTVAATDTMASHAGWAEVTAYTEGVRQTWTDGGVSGQSVDNSASTADFSINANGTTIGGAFLVSDNTKGGTAGTLYAVGAFTVGDKTADSGDTLQVTATFTAATT